MRPARPSAAGLSRPHMCAVCTCFALHLFFLGALTLASCLLRLIAACHCGSLSWSVVQQHPALAPVMLCWYAGRGPPSLAPLLWPPSLCSYTGAMQ